MNLGKAFKDIREEAGCSRPEMARRLGITSGALWKIENGKTNPKQKTIEKFCFEAKVPPAYLYTKALTVEDYVPLWGKPVLVISDPVIE